MLPRENRLRAARDFTHVMRSGRRAGRAELVAHCAPRRDGALTEPPRVGLVVGRSVGNSVIRHRVSRRLRAQVGDRLDRVPIGTDVVLRALPPAAIADSALLGRRIDQVFDKLFSGPAR